jgi:hypothetical protein
MVLNARCGVSALLALVFLRLAAFGCAAPEAFQGKLAEAGAAGTTTGVGGHAAGGAGGDTTSSGLAGTAGFDASLAGTTGLEDAGVSGVAGATGGSGGSVAGQGGNAGADGGTAGMPSNDGGATGGAGAQGGAGGGAGSAGVGGASGAAGSGTAGTGGGAGTAGTGGGAGTAGAGGGAGTVVVDYCDRSHWTATASINAITAPQGEDGNLTTRFTTGRPMQVGDYYQVDFAGTAYLTAVTLNNTQTSPSDYAKSFDLYSSPNGMTWTKFASGPGADNSTTISFAKISMRYIRVQVGTASQNAGLYFSIGEFQVACTDF